MKVYCVIIFLRVNSIAIIHQALSADCTFIWTEKYNLSSLLATDPCPTARELGCSSDCKTFQVCLDIGNGLEWVPAASCDDYTYCNSVAGICSTEYTCEEPVILCDSAGFYPHPVDCKASCECKKGELGKPEPCQVCETSLGYDSCTQSCDIALVGDRCSYTPVPACTTTGHTSALASSKKIYYTCLNIGGKLTYIMGTCPDGSLYDESTDSCIHSSERPCGDEIQSSTQSPLTTTKTTTTCSQVVCQHAGPIPDPCDCRSYYYCYNNLQAIHYTCPTNQYYNDEREACVSGQC